MIQRVQSGSEGVRMSSQGLRYQRVLSGSEGVRGSIQGLSDSED